MSTTVKLALIVFLGLFLADHALAQAQSRQISASASTGQVRFVSLGELIRIRVEVISSRGEVVFDSDFRPGNVIDWPTVDKQGQHLPDGSYLCFVTVKDSSGQI